MIYSTKVCSYFHREFVCPIVQKNLILGNSHRNFDWKWYSAVAALAWVPRVPWNSRNFKEGFRYPWILNRLLSKEVKKVIVSQRNVNQITYISILQFGERYGFGRSIETRFFLNRGFKSHLIKILWLFNILALGFWHHLTQKECNFIWYLLKYK